MLQLQCLLISLSRRVTLAIFFLSIFSTYGKSSPLKLEVICSKNYSQISLKELCTSKNSKCRWTKLESSNRASSWSKRGQLKVIENPLLKGVKIEVINPKLSGMKVPWCFKSVQLNLPKKPILEKIRRVEGTLYLLEKSDTHHLPRLKAIDHPCRKLRSLPASVQGFSFYFLEPQSIKACRTER